MSLLDHAIAVPPPPWRAPDLEWVRLGDGRFAFRGVINGERRCVIGERLNELGSLSRAIAEGRA